MAAGDVLQAEGAPVIWGDTITGGVTEQLDLGTANGNAGAVCVGSYHDFGAAPRAHEYKLDVFIDGFDATPAQTASNTVLVYISESDAPGADGFSGPETPADTTSGAGATARLANMLGPFPITIPTDVEADEVRAVFRFESSFQYLAPVVHNNSTGKFLSTADAHRLTITPLYPQVAQA